MAGHSHYKNMARHKAVREWFTLYFIPVFPIGGKTTYVECEGCRGTFKESVLELEPPTETQILVTKVAEFKDEADIDKNVLPHVGEK